jgi:DNA polymerase III psi subunit
MGLSTLDAYAHFCEVVPEVRRGRLQVRRIKNGFELKHPTTLARTEATDIIVSELAIGHIANRKPQSFSPVMKRLAKSLPIKWEDVFHEAARRIAKYADNVREDQVISEDAMMQVFGFSASRFSQIRCATYALAEVYQELALLSYMETADDQGDPSDDMMSLTSLSWPEAELVDRLALLAGGDPDEVAVFVETFCFDPNAPKLRGGEGYTPPFVRIGTQICFSPDLILRFIQPRNAIQDLMKLDSKRFDNLVSHTLEPTLINAVIAEMSRFPNLKFGASTNYAGGEIDLIIVDPTTHDVVVIEVKAPLPPQGSRLTERLAQRVREGIDQVQRFQALTEGERLAVVAAGTGARLSRATFHYVILARACMGAVELWQADASVSPATLPLLRLASAAIEERKGNAAAELTVEIHRQKEQLLKEARWSWSSGKMPLMGRTIFTPQLRYDDKVVERWRQGAAQK